MAPYRREREQSPLVYIFLKSSHAMQIKASHPFANLKGDRTVRRHVTGILESFLSNWDVPPPHPPRFDPCLESESTSAALVSSMGLRRDIFESWLCGYELLKRKLTFKISSGLLCGCSDFLRIIELSLVRCFQMSPLKYCSRTP